jgi:glucose/arabinose dehydrogenase
MTTRTAPWLAIATVLVLGCTEERTVIGGKPGPTAVDLANAFPNVTFSRPVDIRTAGDGTHRIFVVEQAGRILVLPDDPAAMAATVFLDIGNRVTLGGEAGLLGLAFHPQYASNGYFFVYYITTPKTGGLLSRLSRFRVDAQDPDVADPNSEAILLEFPQRQGNHNGGGLCFDGGGYLCLGVGDEGGAGDPYNNAQDLTTPYGSILRFDVDQNVGTAPYYGIPAGNPFAGNGDGYLEEIFAYGLRNPWRVSYDAVGDDLWAGDVGQGSFEEIDIVTAGGNYGWDCREGQHPYNGAEDPPSPLCATVTGLIDPVWEYSHAEGQSITGGHVYRGSDVAALAGRYVYADYGSGRIWALAAGTSPSSTELLKNSGFAVSTFGVDENGELLVAEYHTNGTPTSIYRIVEVPEPPAP